MSKTNVVRVMLRSALIIAAAGALVVFAATAPIGPGTNTARAGGPVVTRADDPAPDGCKPGDCSVREALEDASGGQTISFNIAGAGPHVIKPTSELPGLVDSVSIDGYTQPGASPNTATAWNAGNASMRIVLDGSLAGAGVNGLSIGGTAVLIRGLVIQNFSGNAIMVGAFANGTIYGNYLGTDPTGSFPAPNGGSGVNVHGSDTAVGGRSPDERNLISGNAEDGIQMNGEGPILITGNFIGTDVRGTAPLANGNDGVQLRDGSQSLIGNSDPGSGNLISGNGGNGLTMGGPGVHGVLVRGNRLGTAGDGTTPLPNAGHGIYVALGAFSNTIGGVSMANWNTIAYNGGDGVSLAVSAGVDNYIDPNILHSNDGLGVDLKDDGITLNDQDDSDTGPNDVMNFPVVTRAEVVDGILEVEGTLNTAPVAFLPIFIFANSECDPSGYGEGERFLGEDIAEGVGPNYTFEATLDSPAVHDGDYITTSASNPESSSEFSKCEKIVGAPAGTAQTWGDADCTNGVNPVDSLKVLRTDAGLGNTQPPGCPAIGDEVLVDGVTRIWADVDCSLALNPVDSLKILRVDAGLNVDQQAGCPGMGGIVVVS